MTEKNDSFENKMQRLSDIVNKMNDGSLTLEDSMLSFQEGVKLSNELKSMLTQAQGQLNVLVDEDDQEKPLN